MPPLRQRGTDLRIPKDQQRRARIHRKFDLMKQTQDHDGDVRTGGGELRSSKTAWFIDE
jgi:hypothetical protein